MARTAGPNKGHLRCPLSVPTAPFSPEPPSLKSMSHALGESSAPRWTRVSSSPGAPVPPSVLMRAYVSSSTSGRPITSYIRPRELISSSPSSSGWENRFEKKPTFERPRRTSDPSRSHARSASEASAEINQRISHIRTRPVSAGPRPTSSSYAPLRSSPLCISPTEEDINDPVPIVLSYTPDPIIHEIHTASMFPSKSSAKAPAHYDLPAAHAVNRRARDSKSPPATTSKRLSFAGKYLFHVFPYSVY